MNLSGKFPYTSTRVEWTLINSPDIHIHTQPRERQHPTQAPILTPTKFYQFSNLINLFVKKEKTTERNLNSIILFQECSIFLFEKRCAEKLHKPKRKETVTEILRSSVKQLERFRHPKILQVLHPIEECPETLAFATERILASLANVLAFYQEGSMNSGTPPATGGSQQQPARSTTLSREYHFLDIEYKYGILQVRFVPILYIPYIDFSPFSKFGW